MATTNSIIDSMYTFLDRRIEQHKEEMITGLQQYIDKDRIDKLKSEVNDGFDKLKSELTTWARDNLSGLKTDDDACSQHNNVFNIVHRRPKSPSSTRAEASSTLAEVRIYEKQSNSTKLLGDQVLVKSENGLNGTQDKVCDVQLGDLLKRKSETDSTKRSRKRQRKSEVTEDQQPISLSKSRLISVKCPKGCPLDFGTREALCRHMAEVHQIAKYRCLLRECINRSYKSSNELTAHLNNKHKNLIEYQCSQCLRSFVNHDHLAIHHAMNHVIGRFKCNFSKCQYTDTNQAKVDRHYHNMHTTHACTFPGCRQVFPNKPALNDHEGTFHNQGMETFYCIWSKRCTYTCNDSSTMVTHIRVKHFGWPISTQEQRQRAITDRRNADDYYRLVYQCGLNDCNYENEYQELLQDHVQKKHGSSW